MESTMGSNIIFLSSEDQRQMKNGFVDLLPWRSFGRKNVGYLLAIARGAQVFEKKNHFSIEHDSLLKKIGLDFRNVYKSMFLLS